MCVSVSVRQCVVCVVRVGVFYRGGVVVCVVCERTRGLQAVAGQ